MTLYATTRLYYLDIEEPRLSTGENFGYLLVNCTSKRFTSFANFCKWACSLYSSALCFPRGVFCCTGLLLKNCEKLFSDLVGFSNGFIELIQRFSMEQLHNFVRHSFDYSYGSVDLKICRLNLNTGIIVKKVENFLLKF